MKLNLVILLIVFNGINLSAQTDSISYSFFVAGHTYGKPGVNNVGFHPPFKQQFPYIKSRPEIEFGVLTGDIVSANPVANDWDEIDQEIDTLGLPVHFAVGNHDMENRPLFESRYGATYYHFISHNDLFIILDPNIDGWRISGDQLVFLTNVIQNNAGITDNIYVFFHQVLWKAPGNEFDHIQWNSHAGRGENLNFWSEVMPLFRYLTNDVIMFAGDLGASWASDVSYDKIDNITLISSGMGHEDGENFVVVNIMTDKSLTYDLICLSDTAPDCLGQLTDHLTIHEITIPQPHLPAEIYVFPNPASTQINLLDNIESEGLLQILDLQGRLILEKVYDVNVTKNSIDISRLSSGTYILRWINEQEQVATKLIIE